jgi:chromosome segregation protein
LGDKISELELQVGPLREQAETAKKYLLLRDELRALEIAVWMRNLENLAEQAASGGGPPSAEAQKNAVNAEIDMYYDTLSSFSDRMHEKDVELEDVRRSISGLEASGAEQDSAVAVLKTKLENNIAESDRIRRELDEQEGRDGGLKSQIAEREARIAQILAEKETLGGEAAGLVGDLRKVSDSSGESSRRLGELFGRENELVSGVGEAKSRLSALASAAQEMYDRERLVSQEAQAAVDKHGALEKERTDCAGRLNGAREELTSLKNVMSGYTLRVESRRRKAEDAGDKKMKMTMELGALKSRISLLTEMEKDYEGYSKAVRLVMQESRRGILKNIRGTVGDLVKTEDKYAVAIETALGGAMQNIIVDTEEDGKEAINYLKRRDGGRATFLPISTVRGGVLEERNLKNEQGYEGLAIDLVRYDGKYAGIYKSLLGRVAVADTLDSAIAIARRNNNSFRIVTLDGQVLNAGGSMTGGSASRNTGILSRANELAQLTGQLAPLEETLARLERELGEAVREKNAAEYELETAGGEMRALEDKVLQLETNLRHYDELLAASENSVKTLKAEAAALDGRISQNGRDTDSARGAIETLETQLAELRGQIVRDTEGQEQLAAERDRINAALSELRAREAALDAEREALAKAVSELAELRDVLTGGRKQQLQYLEELQVRQEEMRREISARETALGKLAEQKKC